MTNLAILSSELNEIQKAVHYFRKALRVHEARLHPSHPDLAQPLRQLATAFARAGQPSQAKGIYERLILLTVHYDPDDLTSYAHVLMQLNDYANAEIALQQALTSTQRIYGMETTQVATALSELALCRRNSRRNHNNETTKTQTADIFSTASFCEQLLRRALAIYNKFEPDSEAVATTLDNLGLVLLDASRCREAALAFDKAVRLRLQCHGPNHPETLDSLAMYRKAREEIVMQGGDTTMSKTADELISVIGDSFDVENDNAMNQSDATTTSKKEDIVTNTISQDLTSEPTTLVTPTPDNGPPSTPEQGIKNKKKILSDSSTKSSPPLRKASLFRSISNMVVSPSFSPQQQHNTNDYNKRRWRLNRSATYNSTFFTSTSTRPSSHTSTQSAPATITTSTTHDSNVAEEESNNNDDQNRASFSSSASQGLPLPPLLRL
eukprot:CAMPEP_0197297428 /NCGR_PEP_ID=MMETSP0890-20130614/41031_1 /TAXON_ID=44058 ORGANISM="Aureoumbra lagunensis, Strain CCMP1510" /NCGR_SAMPLE_ID=MMETSP0890 /ASSEMBLY_ACC=CAM_ASM_000533 /LENGTH=436 /DNA_ID=CAMNT_0042774569 /DNA_START=537 /DNA_END=1847 /DNA_ORIENTATION=+